MSHEETESSLTKLGACANFSFERSESSLALSNARNHCATLYIYEKRNEQTLVARLCSVGD
jgi:hypothetical protein